MKSLQLSRRSALRGAGVAVALPWLEAMTGRTRAARAAAPKRFIAWFSPNGMVNSSSGQVDNWTPTGDATNFTLSTILKPLESLKGDLLIPIGIGNPLGDSNGPGDQHQKGMGTMLTCMPLLPGTAQGGGGSIPAGLASGISVDQEMVNKLNPATKFKSLEVGAQSNQGGTCWDYMSYAGSAKPLPAEDLAENLWDRIFSGFDPGGGGNNDALLRLRNDRKSILDATARNFEILNAKLGREDKVRLDSHLAAIRDVETRLFSGAAPMPGTSGGGCTKPARPGISDGDFYNEGKNQMDLLSLAIACDLTRVATFQWSKSVSDVYFTWLGAMRGHHDMSHDAETNAATQAILTKIDVWYATQFAYFCGRLKSFTEEGGSVLDNTTVFWCNEIARGNHSHDKMPYLFCGKLGGAIKTGRVVRYTNKPTSNQLMVSILNVMGVPATTFGATNIANGPIAGLF